MKTKNVLMIVIAFALTGLSAKAQLKFQKCIGGALGDDYGNCIQQTADSGYIIAGYTTSFGAGNYDVYLIKLDANGDTSWTKTYGDTLNDMANFVRQTRDGGYIIAGQTYNYGAGEYDMLVIKTDASGDTMWTKVYGHPYNDNATSIEQTSDGGYIVGGTMDIGGLGYLEAALMKLDSVGNVAWIRLFSYLYNFVANDVHQTSDGGYILVGSAIYSNYNHVYMVKTDASGDTLWTKYYGGGGQDWGNQIQQTSDNGFVIIGETTSFGAGSGDVYVIKTDSLGLALWSKVYGSTNVDVGYSIKQTPDGGYILGGVSQSFGPNPVNCYLIKINSSGIPAWSKIYGGSGSSFGYSVDITTDGGYVLAGNNTGLGAGGSDVYIIKTDGLGSSGCIDSSVTTVYSTPQTQLLTNVTSIDSVVNAATAAPFINHGGTVSDLCNNVGIKEIVSKIGISLAPNPFTTQTILTLQGTYNNPSLFIYNLLGQEVRNIAVGTNSQITINREHLACGMYFYKLIDENKEVIGIGKMIAE